MGVDGCYTGSRKHRGKMIITYLRSSSYGSHEMCPMKYFLEYNLGWKGPSNIKAEKGTIVHKVLEILGEIKLQQQLGADTFEDDVVGTVDVSDYDVDDLIGKCYDYYVHYSIHKWKPIDRKHCFQWTYKALEYRDGEFDPRNSEMVKAEQAFDFEVNKPWAMYEYELPNGDTVEGFLALKGTIDQISKIDDETYQILDWKTGRRLNWATGEEKDYAALNKDPQLMLYYYAAQHLYPDIENIQIVIYFINDGGPFTICFSRSDIPKIENMLKEKFEDIKNSEMPALNKSWKCTKFCHYGTTTFEDTHIKPIIERREGEVTPKGQCMTKCEQTKYCLQNRSMNSVIKNMSAKGHDINKYDAPGEVKEETK